MRGHDAAACRDPHFEQAVHDGIARQAGVLAQPYLIALPIVNQPRRDMRGDERGVPGKIGAVTGGHGAPPFQDVVQPIQLGEADGRLNIGDAMVIADLGVALEPRRRARVTGIVGQRHALVAQPPQALGERPHHRW